MTLPEVLPVPAPTPMAPDPATHVVRRARRWTLVSSLTIGALLLTLALAACGGEPAISPYPCAPTACVNNVDIVPPAGPSPLSGIYTDMDVRPLTCDAACQASTGVAAPGNIINYIALFDASATYFIRMGYFTTNTGHDAYFYESNLPGEGASFHTPLGDTQIGPGYTDTYTVTSMAITRDRTSPSVGGWYVVFTLNHAAALGGVGLHVYSVTTPSFILSSFVPAHALMGQSLFGHSGATAIFSAFSNNQLGFDVGCGSGTCFPTYSPLTQDGTVAGIPASVPPPYANWLLRPSARNSNGGIFYTECCRPLHIEIG